MEEDINLDEDVTEELPDIELDEIDVFEDSDEEDTID